MCTWLEQKCIPTQKSRRENHRTVGTKSIQHTAVFGGIWVCISMWSMMFPGPASTRPVMPSTDGQRGDELTLEGHLLILMRCTLKPSSSQYDASKELIWSLHINFNKRQWFMFRTSFSFALKWGPVFIYALCDTKVRKPHLPSLPTSEFLICSDFHCLVFPCFSSKRTFHSRGLNRNSSLRRIRVNIHPGTFLQQLCAAWIPRRLLHQSFHLLVKKLPYFP